MSSPKFVPDIGIVDGQISDHKVSHQQFLEHVGQDVSSPLLLIRAEDLQPRGLQCRLDQVTMDSIKIDLIPLAVLLHTKRHRNKRVRLHSALLN